MLWPRGADGDDAVRGRVTPPIEHRAMMLAVATAARRQTCVGILRERKQRREHGKREGREQQDGEKASHKEPNGSSVRPFSKGRSLFHLQVADLFCLYAADIFHLSVADIRFIQRSSGLSWV